MHQMQQTVFENLGKSSMYQSKTKKIMEYKSHFPKYRRNEIQNEFQLVDTFNVGKLSQQQIVGYLRQKYQSLNINILGNVFKKMRWDSDGKVSKEQFCSKYLEKEKKLFHEIKRIKNYAAWNSSIHEILNDSIKDGVMLYAFAQIQKVHIDDEASGPIQWMDIICEYQNHRDKTNYILQMLSYEPDQQSFKILLPIHQNRFFIKMNFKSCKQTHVSYGRACISVQVKDQSPKQLSIQVPITVQNKKKGFCVVKFTYQTQVDHVRDLLNKNRFDVNVRTLEEEKIKQFQYLQFLWGIRHKPPHKLKTIQAVWISYFRTIFALLFLLFALAIHTFGRYQPVSFIILYFLVSYRKYIFMRSQTFMLVWLTLAAIFLDVGWLVFASNNQSEINFVSLAVAQILTYVLLGFKAIFLVYLLLVERAFDTAQD